jgi:hypothetical protein
MKGYYLEGFRHGLNSSDSRGRKIVSSCKTEITSGSVKLPVE